MKKPNRLPTFEWFASNASMISAPHNDGCARVLPNMALNLAPFSRWTLRDKAAQRRLASR
ncbi:MAG: hypothetical protein H6R15_1716 [Proteobacteria bacterium]|nr:hypothetical protein [Pseudomonadota bacterium]